jgi:hypothetical protein
MEEYGGPCGLIDFSNSGGEKLAVGYPWGWRLSVGHGNLSLNWNSSKLAGAPLSPGFCGQSTGIGSYRRYIYADPAGSPRTANAWRHIAFHIVDLRCEVMILLFAAYPTIAFIRGPVRRWRRRRRGCCLNCGYDLTGNVSGVCPECGEAI